MLFIVIVAIFLLFFSLIFLWIRKANKKDKEEEKMSVLMTGFVAGVLALILAGVVIFFLFIVLGSTSVINTLFTLDISRKDMVLMSAVMLVFLFTVDNIFQIAVTLLTSNLYLFYFIMLWLRMVSFYLIGSFFTLSHEPNLMIAGGVALIFSLLELLYDLKAKG